VEAVAMGKRRKVMAMDIPKFPQEFQYISFTVQLENSYEKEPLTLSIELIEKIKVPKPIPLDELDFDELAY
jgi:hypothetical protein